MHTPLTRQILSLETGGLDLPPVTSPAATEPAGTSSPAGSGARRAFLPFAAPTHAPTPAHEAAKHPAAAHPGGRGVTCPHRAAGAPPSPAARDGAAVPSPGRAVALLEGRADRHSAALYAPATALDLPAALRWSLPPCEVAALAASILSGTAATLWFAVLIGGL